MIRGALLGLGNIAWKYDANRPESGFALTQAGAMLRHPEVELVGGCSPDAADRRGFSDWSGGLPVFTAPGAMLEQLRPDLVGICSPTQEHFTHVLQCLESGVRVIWLEKPPTSDSGQLEQLLRRAEHCQATVCVNYFRRYLPSYRQLRKLMQDQTYGPCLNIRITYSPGLARNGVHLLDQLFFLTGAHEYKLLWVEKGGDASSPSFALRLPGGQLVLGCGGSAPYHTNDISVQCAEGMLTIARGGKETAVAKCLENELFPGFFDLHPQNPCPLGSGGLEGYMQASLEDLLLCAMNGEAPQSGLRSALLTQQLLEAILRGAGL